MPENTVIETWMETRDGVKLYTVVQLPKAEGRFPLIVRRNPYAKEKIDIEEWKHGEMQGGGKYGVVLQHCRGTGMSEGICIPYLSEHNDGLDLLEWIRKQPFYQGELFLSGGSYLSSVHFSYLSTNPPDVKAAFLAVQDSERYNILYRNGFFKSGLHGSWSMIMYKRITPVERNLCNESFRTLPLAGITRSIFNEEVPALEEEFRHPDPHDPFWKTPAGGSEYHDACRNCDIPILLVTAFYDIYTGGVLDIWNGLPEERKKRCACIVTPFSHDYNPMPRTTPSELPDFENARLREICPDLEINWFEHFRTGEPLQFAETGKIKYYTLFENQWHCGSRLENGAEKREYYLHPDRTLKSAPAESGEVTYVYNPYAPAPFAGGCCLNFGGMQIQDPPNSRYDIISFLSDPVEEETLLCQGKFEVELHCRSTAPDTCFYVRLDLVRDGKTFSLRDEIDSLCRAEKDYTPGSERILKFSLIEHSFQLRKGDQIRLDVSSSCVPYFQVHTNRKGLQADQTGADICRNTVITGKSVLRIFCR